MSNELQTSKRPLPKIDELYGDIQLASKQNELNRLLNCNPKPEWVRDHPFVKTAKYIPIGIIEYLLTSIFIKWRVEIKEASVIANSVKVIIRLHVQDPISGEWDWQDGIGAAPIQTEKGAAATDFNKVLTDAVMKSAPSAESYAIKDAAEKFGKIFGKDLNRVDWMAYTNLDGKIDLDSIQSDPELMAELYGLLYSSDLSHDEADEMKAKFQNGISVAYAETLKMELLDRQITPLEKIKRGDTVSQAEINKAVKQKV